MKNTIIKKLKYFVLVMVMASAFCIAGFEKNENNNYVKYVAECGEESRSCIESVGGCGEEGRSCVESVGGCGEENGSYVECFADFEEKENSGYICDAGSFMRAIQGGNSEIFVGDISFETQTEIKINYSVKIVGKSEKSLIQNAYFTIKGKNVVDQNLEISFKNIVFDGKVEKSCLSLVEGKTFSEIVDEIPQYRCFDGCVGYYDLNIDNCEIKNYLCEEGPAIYINNDSNYRAGKKVLNLTNTKVYDNISNLGTVKVFSDVLTTNIDGCEFYGNLARAGQGIAVGNGKSTIKNTTVHDNDFFRFVNAMERKLPKIFNGDKQTFNGVTTNALGSCCGAIFIGGSNTIVDNCKIFNNKTIFGGGIGIFNSETLDVDEKIEIKNTEIKNNIALLCGGGIYLESNQGETTYFSNCNIIGNSAGEKGSVIYTTTYSPDVDAVYGGNVQFTFCTIAENSATDTSTFNYYDLRKPELAGTISLKGCFVLGNDEYISSEDEYNYVATNEQAIADNVVTEDDIENISKNGIRPKSESIGDIKVPPRVYGFWLKEYSNAEIEKSIGYSELLVNCINFDDTTPENNKNFPYWILIFPSILLCVVVVFAICFKDKNLMTEKELAFVEEKPKQIETTENIEKNIESIEQISLEENNAKIQTEEQTQSQENKVIESTENILTKENNDAQNIVENYYTKYTHEEIFEKVKKLYDKVLTKTEILVATEILYGKSRKEIAQKLIVSEETIKTHLSNIFKKTSVSSKIEFKKITEQKLFDEKITL